MSVLPGETAKLKNFIKCKIFFTHMYEGAFERVVRDPTISETDTGESFSNISALASMCFSYCYVIRCVLRCLEDVSYGAINPEIRVT
jgi:hypothetical protein